MAQLGRYPALDAIGVAGFSRALSPEKMAEELRPAFLQLRELGTEHVHYKVCSTFDSSPEVGSIGRAIDIGQEIFQSPFVPVLVGSPLLGRYCVFGNLFARYGIGSAGAIHRLDRHPSVSRHPVTPMTEADLALHLSSQTRRSIGKIDILQLDRGEHAVRTGLQASIQSGIEIVLFDTLSMAHLELIGKVLNSPGPTEKPTFSVGSSAVETAFFANSDAPKALDSFEKVSPATTFVISGSCSPVTAEQIQHAKANGFSTFLFRDSAAQRDDVVQALNGGRSVVVYTSLGEAKAERVAAETLGAALGIFAREILSRTSARRLVIAGGDTASYATRALGVEGIEIQSFLAPGAPLCRATISGCDFDRLELVCKGGQVGASDFFNVAAFGASSR